MTKPLISSRQRWKYILIVGGLQTLQPFSVDPLLPAAVGIARDFAVPETVIQLTLSALTLGFALGQLISGPLSDAIGRRKPIVIGSSIFVISTLLTANAPFVEFFMVSRFLQGLSAAAVAVICNAVLRDLYDGLPLLKAMSRALLIQALSWFIGPLAGSQLLAIMDWRGVSLVVSSFAVVMLIIATKFLPETLHVDNRRETIFQGMLPRFRHVLKDRIYVGLLIISALNSFGLWAYLSAAPFVLTNQFGLEPAQFGALIAVNSFGAYIGVQLASKLAQYVPAQWILVGLHVATTVLGISLWLQSGTNPSLWQMAILLWLFVVGFGFTVTPIGALSLAPHGEEAGTAASLMAVIGSLVTAAAGPLYASLSKQDMSGIGIAIAAAHLIALLVMFTVVRPKQVPALAK